MSPLFGAGKDDGADNAAAAAAEIERLSSLPLAQLGAEVMMKGFGPDGPGGPGKPGTLEAPYELSAERVGLAQVTRAVTPLYAAKGVGPDSEHKLAQIVAEGIQVLEKACLVRTSWNGGQDNILATRLGRATLEQGTLERVLSGGSQ